MRMDNSNKTELIDLFLHEAILKASDKMESIKMYSLF